MKIRTSLYRTVFSLIVFPFFLFTLLITNIYSGRLEKVITESLYVVANTQVSEMTNFCEQQRKYLSLLGGMDVSRSVLRGNTKGGAVQYLDDILSSYTTMVSYMKTLTVLDKEHRVVSSSARDHLPYAADGIGDLVESMGSQSFYISDVLVDADGNKTLVAISAIEDAGGLMGYALAEIDLDFYKNIRKKTELWNDATFYLVDGKRQIISAGTQDEEREDFVTTAEDRRDYIEKYTSIDFVKNPQGSFQYKVAGKEYITYYSDVEYTNWRVLLTTGLDSYKAEQTVYSILASVLLLLCIILAVWSGRFASRRIVRPIQKISDTLRGIQSNQDYSLRVPVERKDELGNLGTEINGLIDFIETENLYKAKQQRLLREKAEQDALTKVLNKERISQYLMEAMDCRRREGARIAVLFVDIDDFKAFNTHYGHNVGDQVLLFIAALLARETGGTVGRVGGDEFLVVVENEAVLHELELYLDRIQKQAESQFVVRGSGANLSVTCCIGAVRIDLKTESSRSLTPEKLIGMADEAMYQVKNSGKRGYVVLDM
ncbi:GGDEF domain-containing protein [Clostridium sp. AN503]|uniref:sensor domain-containing diguanylate cyclase n=1 Tax=Clostridium sp. AN503 TaxID=3160598 RepID=UPI0034583D63